MKTCTKCGQDKPLTAFYQRYSRPGTLSSWCKACHTTDGLRYKRTNIEARRRYALTDRVRKFRRQFGITPDDYNRLFAAQGGLCAVCGRPETAPGNALNGTTGTRMLAVDHDHESGRVRGLLCANCNRAIGLFTDNPALLRRAADYIEEHRHDA